MSVDVYLLDHRWVFTDRYRLVNGVFSVKTPNPSQTVPRDALAVIVDPASDMDAAVNQVQGVLGQRKLGSLFIGAHGNPGIVHIGKGLKLENAGSFGSLRDNFDPYKRVIKIMACGVMSDTPLRPNPDLCKNLPVEQRFPETCAKPWLGNWSANYNPGMGYQLVKALANMTHAPVQASIHVVDTVYPDYFIYKTQTVYIYPDDDATQEKYFKDDTLIKHNDFCTLDYDPNGNLISSSQ
jgi:hypothetical protein